MATNKQLNVIAQHINLTGFSVKNPVIVITSEFMRRGHKARPTRRPQKDLQVINGALMWVRWTLCDITGSMGATQGPLCQLGATRLEEALWLRLIGPCWDRPLRGGLLAELWESHLLIVFIWHFTLWSAESMTRVQCI